MQETWVQSLGQEDSLEEEMQWTSVFLPGKSQGQRSLAGYSPWGYKDRHTHPGMDAVPPAIEGQILNH